MSVRQTAASWRWPPPWRGAVVFDHPAADRAFLDHRRELAHVHVGHAARGVAGVEVAAEEVVLRLGRPGAARHALEGGVAPEHPALAARRREVGHDDPRREAGGAAGAGGAVEHVLRAAEALVRQHVVEMARAVALQRGEELALHLAGKVRARLRSRHVELVRLRQRVAHERPRCLPLLTVKGNNSRRRPATGFSCRGECARAPGRASVGRAVDRGRAEDDVGNALAVAGAEDGQAADELEHDRAETDGLDRRVQEGGQGSRNGSRRRGGTRCR